MSSSISVVQYNTIVMQNTTNFQQIKNEKREVIVLRQPPHILPQPPKHDILLTNTSRKKIKSNSDVKANPQPVAVARRNARERNRVKQVNNGFANLRQHIPNFIAAAFESNNGRGGNKKLSKVETLRMAVEYIRSLESLLAMDQTSENSTYNYSHISSPIQDDEISSTPPSSSQQDYFENIYENGENLDPLIDSNQIILDEDLDLEEDLSYLKSSPLSPGLSSDPSMSPGVLDKGDPNCFIHIFQNNVRRRLSPQHGAINNNKGNVSELPVLSLRNENELPAEHKHNVIDVIQWWELQQQQQQQIAQSTTAS